MDQLHIAESLAAVLSSEFVTPLGSRLAEIGLALMAVLQGDLDAAKELYVRLKSAAGSYLRISGERVLELLAQTMGEQEQAAVHF